MKRKLIPVEEDVSLSNDLIMFPLTKRYPNKKERFQIIGNNVELAYDLCERFKNNLSKTEFFDLVDTYTYCLHYKLLQERK